jgi:tetratricopeptide (TPR) repeat protein
MAILVPTVIVMWSISWIQWIQATGLPPSLALPLPGGPFGHRHDVALLIALLLPAALAVWGGGMTRRLAVGGLLVVAMAVLFMSGGRAVWLGVGVASVVALATSDQARDAMAWLRDRWVAIGGLAVVLSIALVASGIGGSLVARVFATESLGMRGAIWSSTLSEWLERPLGGSGPATFQFGIQATDYFDRSVFAPKHADNLYLQTLTELGVVGSACLAFLAFAVLRSWQLTPPSRPILWAMTFVAVAGIGANPAAIGYCAILITVWAGLATRWRPSEQRPMPGWVGAATPIGLFMVAAIPLWTTTAAALAFDRAREQSNAGEMRDAVESLDEAVVLDPTFPLYPRERGIIHARDGRNAMAVEDLLLASGLNPLDDTTFRALALVSLEDGRAEAGLSAARRAVELQATDPMNQATLALALDDAGLDDERDGALRLLLVLAPWSAADEAWAAQFASVDAAPILRAAAQLVDDRPLADTVDQRWTAALAGVSGISRQSGYLASQEAMGHVVGCRFAEASRVLNATAPSDRSDPELAFARAIVARLTGSQFEPDTIPDDTLAGAPLGDPIVDQSRYARRPPLPWDQFRLPSSTGGRLAWLDDPERALSATRGSPC